MPSALWVPLLTFRDQVIADLTAMGQLSRVDPANPAHPDNLYAQITQSMKYRKRDEVFVTYASWVIDAEGLRVRIKVAAARRNGETIEVTTDEAETNRIAALP